MKNFLELFWYAGSAVGSVFIIALAGAWLVRKEILPRNAMNTLSRLVFSLFLPCLLFSKVAESVSWAQLSEYWIFPVSCVVFIATGTLLGKLLVRLCRPRQVIANGIVAAIGFGNSGYLPIPLLLTATAIFPEFSSNPVAGDQAVAFISVYLLASSPMLWTLGFSIIAGRKFSELSLRKIFTPPVIAMFLGIVVGLTPPLKSWFCSSGGVLNPLFRAISTIAMATVPCALIVLGGGLSAGPVRGVVNRRTIFSVILVKLIIFPVLATGYVLMLRYFGIFPANLIAALVLIVEAGVPPANNLAVIASLVCPEMQQGLSTLLFWVYLASTLTLTLTIMLAMRFFA